jgi:hypothetical protein
VAKVADAKQAALVRARQQRIALDRDRDARDRRLEHATAEVLVLLDQRAQAEQRVDAVNAMLGGALRSLLAEGVVARVAAQLVCMEVAEVRRLVRPSPESTADATCAAHAGRQPNIGRGDRTEPTEQTGIA